MFPQNLWVRSLRAPTRANLRSWSMESSQRRRTPLEATPFALFRFSNSHLTWLEFGERKKLKFYWLLPTPKLSCVSSIITTNFVFIFITIIIILPASLHLHHHHHHQHDNPAQMEDILATFDGAFKEQETANSNWLPVRDMKVSRAPLNQKHNVQRQRQQRQSQTPRQN